MDEKEGRYSHNPGDDWNKKRDSSDELKKKERSFYRPDNKTNASDNGKSIDRGGLYKAESGGKLKSAGLNAIAGATPWGKVLKFAGKHKKGAAGVGGGITTFIIGIVALFGFIASHELVTIQQDMLKYEDKGVSYIVKKAGNQIMKRMMCHSLASSSGCKSVNTEEDVTNPKDPMTSEIDQFSFTDPRVEAGLSNEGIQVEKDASGNFTGLKDLQTGRMITPEDFSNPELAARIQSAIPEWDVGQEATFRSLMIEHSGATFDPITSPDENNKDVQDNVTADLSGTEDTGAQLADAQAEDNNQTSANATPQEQAQAQLDQSISGESNSILEAANKGISEGQPESQVIADAQTAAESGGIGKDALITTGLSDMCDVEGVASGLSKSRIPTIMSFLVRHATTLISIADEMKVGGKLSGGEISKVTSMFNGNSSAPKGSQSRLPFSMSAAWKRISGGHVTNKNPGISSTALPVATAATTIINKIHSIFNQSHLTQACGVMNNSILGGIVGVVGTAGQFIADGVSAGLSQLAESAVLVVANTVIIKQAIPLLVKYLTPVGLDGLENAVQWMNNSDAGANLAFNMYAQRLGGSPLTQGQATALYTKGSQMQQVTNSNRSFLNRTFAFSNPNSLVSKLMVDLPLSRIGMINSFFGVIFNAPSMLFHDLGILLAGAKAYASTTPTNPGQAYGFTQYGFNPGDITKYDPISNEQYLFNTTISYGGSTDTLINLLGNPNKYPNASDDNNSQDVLHCFTQGYYNTASNTTADPICGTMGIFDSQVAPQPITKENIAYSFCLRLAPGRYFGGCLASLPSYPQLQGLATRFRQYILDDEVTGFYTSLMNSK